MGICWIYIAISHQRLKNYALVSQQIKIASDHESLAAMQHQLNTRDNLRCDHLLIASNSAFPVNRHSVAATCSHLLLFVEWTPILLLLFLAKRPYALRVVFSRCGYSVSKWKTYISFIIRTSFSWRISHIRSMVIGWSAEGGVSSTMSRDLEDIDRRQLDGECFCIVASRGRRVFLAKQAEVCFYRSRWDYVRVFCSCQRSFRFTNNTIWYRRRRHCETWNERTNLSNVGPTGSNIHCKSKFAKKYRLR